MSTLMVYRPKAGNRRYLRDIRTGALSAVALIVLVSLLHPSSFNGIAFHPSEAIAAPTRSTTIALTSDETRLVVVNREANSISIIQVKDANGNDVANKLAEIAVGQEPRCVAVHPTDRAAYVTNAITGIGEAAMLCRGIGAAEGDEVQPDMIGEAFAQLRCQRSIRGGGQDLDITAPQHRTSVAGAGWNCRSINPVGLRRERGQAEAAALQSRRSLVDGRHEMGDMA